MSKSAPILYKMLQNDVCEITLNRAHKSNSLNRELIVNLSEYLQKISTQATIRVLIITANGKWFCGGADLNWMLQAGQCDTQQNYNDALLLAKLFYLLNNLPLFTIAKVSGGAMGGGIGLLCCCDMVVASEDCDFSFTELKLDLMPATIMPYVLATIGERQARRYILSGERFNSEQAKRIGLIHEVVKNNELEQQVQQQVALILCISADTFRQAKSLLQQYCLFDKRYIEQTAHILAQSRSSTAAQQAMQVFFDKSLSRS